ncbi:hypothetical protein [Magnetospirillum sp. 15-1]|uniref:hypothetical protein n=1 Tax=Magnetospirillum sp. 15-1 TaxID=1979370 RepID=UPI000BBCA3BB|nr:hypothetical protein [Magnetospirillum sp. 15-1]
MSEQAIARMTYHPTYKAVVVPPGYYWVGDPCTVITGDQWDELGASNNWFERPIGTVSGQNVVAFPTASGDGVYRGSDGFEYGVDAGVIGLTPIALCEHVPRNLMAQFGRTYYFEKTLCGKAGGSIWFDLLHIDTGPRRCEPKFVKDRRPKRSPVNVTACTPAPELVVEPLTLVDIPEFQFVASMPTLVDIPEFKFG